ncbi:hypothetical protein [Scytonema sp. UIC 10036]|uniref:hypothetical protein n=1 Tax=Scytonema sp. UIC 10036 TaxID=2304196 RepID=UPI00140FB4CD|nr:hypothetical protein [Scytonema sp. UIC 10036]
MDTLKSYKELNTPLPFIVFGVLEHLFNGGIFAGRLVNFVFSFAIALLIGFSSKNPTRNSVLAVCGLMLFPYYLWLGTVIYTDIFATFFVLLGVWFYTRSQHIISCLAFILAIASRQYMLVFPVAIASHELISFLKNGFRMSRRWIAPLIAASSIFIWIWLFNGLAPSTAISQQTTPDVQKSISAFSLHSSLYFLACMGIYFVIPEWMLFSRNLNKQNFFNRRNIYIALVLLVLFVFFPPLEAHGILIKLEGFLPNDFLRVVIFYCFAALTCMRFSRINLAFWLVFIHCGLMLKAYPWDKYTLPLVVVFWYLKSVDALAKKDIKEPSFFDKL